MEITLIETYLDILIKAGFTDCRVVAQPSYRGSIYIHRFIKARKHPRSYLFFEKDVQKESASVTALKNVLGKLPHAAKIGETYVIGQEFLVGVEEATGYTNLWEIEEGSALPTQDELQAVLMDIVRSLCDIRWVHADIRPWNIYFHTILRKFVVIDWWGSRPMDDQGKNLDKEDADRLLSLFNGEATLESIWSQPFFTMTWNPPWARRDPTPDGLKPPR